MHNGQGDFVKLFQQTFRRRVVNALLRVVFDQAGQLLLFLLQFDGCPSWQAGLENMKAALLAEGLACALLFLASRRRPTGKNVGTMWRADRMGGGDAKLWMALLWLAPSGAEQAAFVVMAASLVATGLLQLVWRKFRKQPATGVRGPSAWRTVPYAVWLFAALLRCW